jgi:hypothetical protein
MKLTKAQLRQGIKTFCDEIRSEGCDFSLAVIFPGPKGTKHDGVEHMSAKDDHHAMDLIHNQMNLWTRLNHKEKK